MIASTSTEEWTILGVWTGNVRKKSNKLSANFGIIAENCIFAMPYEKASGR